MYPEEFENTAAFQSAGDNRENEHEGDLAGMGGVEAAFQDAMESDHANEDDYVPAWVEPEADELEDELIELTEAEEIPED